MKLITLFCCLAIHLSTFGYAQSEIETKNPLSSVILANNFYNKKIPIQSWKSKKFQEVVRQQFDYSCGASSLATILKYFYNQNVTEAEILDVLDNGSLRASFDDMQRVLPFFGFKAKGFAANYEDLVKLKIPVIVYLQYRNNQHFSVLKAINNDSVILADPSLGLQSYSKEQFLSAWETRQEIDNPIINDGVMNVWRKEQVLDHKNLKGKIFVVVPLENNDQKHIVTKNNDFFHKNPIRNTSDITQSIRYRWGL
jgi:predicted double-glycine peptidase